MKKYRIVRDLYAGYECQVWYVYWPFWVQMNFSNTHRSIEEAKQYIKNHEKVVWVSHPTKLIN